MTWRTAPSSPGTGGRAEDAPGENEKPPAGAPAAAGDGAENGGARAAGGVTVPAPPGGATFRALRHQWNLLGYALLLVLAGTVHLCVLAATICHFFAIFYYVLPEVPLSPHVDSLGVLVGPAPYATAARLPGQA